MFDKKQEASGTTFLASDGYWHKIVTIIPGSPHNPQYPLIMDLTYDQKIRFFSQLEVALAKLFRLFLGKDRSPKYKFEDENIEVLSENIENIKWWKNVYNKDNNTIDGWPINPDGSVNQSTHSCTKFKKIINLGAIGVCTWFIGDTDCTAYNFGLVEMEDYYLSERIDFGLGASKTIFDPIIFDEMFKIFSFDFTDIGFLEAHFPKALVSSSKMLKEMYETVFLIINTPTNEITDVFNCIDDEFLVEINRLKYAFAFRKQSLATGANQDLGFMWYSKNNWQNCNRSTHPQKSPLQLAIINNNKIEQLTLLKLRADIIFRKIGVFPDDQRTLHTDLTFMYQSPKDNIEREILDILDEREDEIIEIYGEDKAKELLPHLKFFTSNLILPNKKMSLG